MATNDALDKIFAQSSKLTTHIPVMASNIETLKIENDTRIDKIQKYAKLSCIDDTLKTIITDRRTFHTRKPSYQLITAM